MKIYPLYAMKAHKRTEKNVLNLLGMQHYKY